MTGINFRACLRSGKRGRCEIGTRCPRLPPLIITPSVQRTRVVRWRSASGNAEGDRTDAYRSNRTAVGDGNESSTLEKHASESRRRARKGSSELSRYPSVARHGSRVDTPGGGGEIIVSFRRSLSVAIFSVTSSPSIIVKYISRTVFGQNVRVGNPPAPVKVATTTRPNVVVVQSSRTSLAPVISRKSVTAATDLVPALPFSSAVTQSRFVFAPPTPSEIRRTGTTTSANDTRDGATITTQIL